MGEFYPFVSESKVTLSCEILNIDFMTKDCYIINVSFVL